MTRTKLCTDPDCSPEPRMSFFNVPRNRVIEHSAITLGLDNYIKKKIRRASGANLSVKRYFCRHSEHAPT